MQHSIDWRMRRLAVAVLDLMLLCGIIDTPATNTLSAFIIFLIKDIPLPSADTIQSFHLTVPVETSLNYTTAFPMNMRVYIIKTSIVISRVFLVFQHHLILGGISQDSVVV